MREVEARMSSMAWALSPPAWAPRRTAATAASDSDWERWMLPETCSMEADSSVTAAATRSKAARWASEFRARLALVAAICSLLADSSVAPLATELEDPVTLWKMPRMRALYSLKAWAAWPISSWLSTSSCRVRSLRRRPSARALAGREIQRLMR